MPGAPHRRVALRNSIFVWSHKGSAQEVCAYQAEYMGHMGLFPFHSLSSTLSEELAAGSALGGERLDLTSGLLSS